MAQNQTEVKTEDKNISEQDVIEFLNQNVNFVENNMDQLLTMNLIHQSGAATSLIERQVKLLREENNRLKENMNQLVLIARENENLSHKIHSLFLEIMKAESVDDLLATVQEQFLAFFNTDDVRFRFYSMNELKAHISDDLIFKLKNRQASQIKKWLQQRKPACADLTHEILSPLYADNDKIKSFAAIPLYAVKEYGVILLGSEQADRFSEKKGDIFLKQLAELVSYRLVTLIA